MLSPPPPSPSPPPLRPEKKTEKGNQFVGLPNHTQLHSTCNLNRGEVEELSTLHFFIV